jgi:hypothetical protein
VLARQQHCELPSATAFGPALTVAAHLRTLPLPATNKRPRQLNKEALKKEVDADEISLASERTYKAHQPHHAA